MRPPAPPPISSLQARAAGTGHAAGPSLAGEICRIRGHVDQTLSQEPETTAAEPETKARARRRRRTVLAGAHGYRLPVLRKRRRRQRNRKRRRVVGEGDAEEAAASGDPSLTPAPAPGTSLPASSSAVPISHVPAAPHASAAQRPAAAAEESDCQIDRPAGDDRVMSMPPMEGDARVGREEESNPAEELEAAPAPHAPTASSAPPSRVLAAPHASATPFSCIPSAQSSPLPISGIPAAPHATTNCPSKLSPHIAAAPHTSTTPLPRIPPARNATATHHVPFSRTPAVPHATASQALHCPMPPPRQPPERAAASGCSYPPPGPKRPAAVPISQVPAAPRMPPPRLLPPTHTSPPPKPRPFLLSPSYACPPRAMPPPPLRQRAPPTSSPCPMPPPTTSRLQGSSPSAPLPAVAAASLLRPTLCEISQRLAPPAAEESKRHQVRNVQPREREDSKSAKELKDGRISHVKSVPPRDATVGREEESKSAEELKSELDRVSKQMNDLKNECAELKRGMKNKDLEIEAKEAEIQNFKKAKLGCSSKDICSTRMDIDQSFHTPANEALQDGGCYWTSTRRDEKLNGVMKELHSTETQQAPGNTQVILNRNNSGQVPADSTAQSGRAGDWQEEIYQMIKSLKDQYFAELNELFNKISLNLQHVDNIIPRQMPSEQYVRRKSFKIMLGRILQFLLQTSKSTIQSSMRDKVPQYEKQIISILNSQRKNPVQPQIQQQLLQVQMNHYKGTSTSGVQTDTKAALQFRSCIPVAAPAAYVPGTPHANAAYVPGAPHVNAAYVPGAPHVNAASVPRAPHANAASYVPSAPPANAAYVPGVPHANAAYVPGAPHATTPASAYVPGVAHAYAGFAAPHFRIPVATCTAPSATTTSAPLLHYLPAAPHASSAFSDPRLPHPR